MVVEHPELGSYRLEPVARDALEASSRLRERVAVWILDLQAHHADKPVLSGELVRFFERLLELETAIRIWMDVGQRISADDDERLWRKLKLEWNYNSNHIEGNTLTYHETELLLVFGRTAVGHPMRDYEEMKAHDVAIDHVRRLAAEERELSEAEIRQLNGIVLKEPFWAPAETPDGRSTRKRIVPGVYKREPNHVRTSTGRLHRFAEPSDTPSQMAAWTRDFHRDMTRCACPLPWFLAESHRSFLAIHPFDDGNGRTARLLVNFALLRRRLPPIVIKTDHRDRYIAGLQSADLGQILPLATFMMENALWSLDLAIRAAKGESIEAARDVDKEVALFVRRRHGGPAAPRDIDILDNVFFLLVRPTMDALDARFATVVVVVQTPIRELPGQYRNKGNQQQLPVREGELARNKGPVPGGPGFSSERRETDRAGIRRAALRLRGPREPGLRGNDCRCLVAGRGQLPLGGDYRRQARSRPGRERALRRPRRAARRTGRLDGEDLPADDGCRRSQGRNTGMSPAQAPLRRAPSRLPPPYRIALSGSRSATSAPGCLRRALPACMRMYCTPSSR